MKRISLIILLCFILFGCTNTQPNVIYKTEYQNVYIPVVYKLERPKRPIYAIEDSVPVYLSNVLKYTEILEIIIDEHNQKETIYD